jgi:nitrile hydratase
MSDDHHHEHGNGATSHLGEMDLRVRALETLLVRKGYVDPAAVDRLIETYETQVGPHNGARVVARAWADPAYAAWLARDATAAIADLGYSGRQGEHMVAVFNTPTRTTWWSAPCVPATPGRCWACRRSGTSRRPTARAW